MARSWVGTVETLADAVAARRPLWALCKWCGHAVRFDPRHLASLLDGATPLGDLQRKLSCRRCGHRRAAVVVDDRESSARD